MTHKKNVDKERKYQRWKDGRSIPFILLEEVQGEWSEIHVRVQLLETGNHCHTCFFIELNKEYVWNWQCNTVFNSFSLLFFEIKVIPVFNSFVWHSTEGEWKWGLGRVECTQTLPYLRHKEVASGRPSALVPTRF